MRDRSNDYYIGKACKDCGQQGFASANKRATLCNLCEGASLIAATWERYRFLTQPHVSDFAHDPETADGRIA